MPGLTALGYHRSKRVVNYDPEQPCGALPVPAPAAYSGSTSAYAADQRSAGG
ncbi:hypothetical protein AB0442_37395 [Kitasatospora sp. NPDC085895]|uniref:hypothetical protein n=1 Tax=Kitasatospora sp. NPDC085895 TaxID=3155057 RepID=UPI00345025E6